MTEDQINHMVSRFLAWRLPENFAPDGGISFEPVGNAGTLREYKREPTGTNLLDYSQAKAMVLHMLADWRDKDGFDMRAFSTENRLRCEALNGFNHPINDWSLSDWMTATMGELGEAANVLKKMNRARDGVTNVGDAPVARLHEQFADEIADTFIYLDLLAQAAGVDLATVVRVKFERTSAKIGFNRPTA